MSQENEKYANWCATIYYGSSSAPSEDDLLPAIAAIKAKCSYWIMGRELCPTTHRKHFQCYFEFKVRQRRSTLCRVLACHWEAAGGTAESNFVYCTKSGDYALGGTPKPDPVVAISAGSARGGDANAARWKRAREIICNSETLDDLDDQIFVQHFSAVQSIRKKYMRAKEDLDLPEGAQIGIWLHGKSGCGKSRKARADYPGSYMKMCNKWWDGYRGQDTVIIDDFDKEHACLAHHLKIWVDRYAFTSEDKGGADFIRPKVVVVTSNWSPSEIWSDEKDLGPILRRFKVINMSPLDGAFLPSAVPTFVFPMVPLDRVGPVPPRVDTQAATQIVNLADEDTSDEEDIQFTQS